jgi:hypothetical protein
VASYGTKDAGIPCAAWQYSDKQLIAGARTDISVDYSGMFTGNNEMTIKKRRLLRLKTSGSMNWV